jgi:hypothetical protein
MKPRHILPLVIACMALACAVYLQFWSAAK